jgi:hypothetical protein
MKQAFHFGTAMPAAITIVEGTQLRASKFARDDP